MTTIFDALRHDHDRQRELLDELLATRGASGNREQLFRELRRELTSHADHEERNFYVPLFEHDLTQDKARHSVSEHKEIDDFIEQLEGYELDAPQWIQTAGDLAHRLRHHLEEEEREVFQLAGKVLDGQQKSELAKTYEAAMTAAREG